MSESNLFVYLVKFILNVVEHSKWQTHVYVRQQAVKWPWWRRRRSEVVTKETHHFRTYCTESLKRCVSRPLEPLLNIVVLSNAQCHSDELTTAENNDIDVRTALNKQMNFKGVHFSWVQNSTVCPSVPLFWKSFSLSNENDMRGSPGGIRGHVSLLLIPLPPAKQQGIDWSGTPHSRHPTGGGRKRNAWRVGRALDSVWAALTFS